MISPNLLLDAAQALEDLSEGQVPDTRMILAGVTGMDAIEKDSVLDGNEFLAAQVFLRDALSGKLNLSGDQCDRAASLAKKIRQCATTQ